LLYSSYNNRIAVLDKNSLSVIFFTFGGGSLIPVKIHNCRSQERNPPMDVLAVKFSSNNKHIYYIATQASINVYDQRICQHPIETFKGNIIINSNNYKYNLYYSNCWNWCYLNILADVDYSPAQILSCFDINSDERFIAAGTELKGVDAFIFFWDVRYTKREVDVVPNFRGGYWESHTNDITCLAFHPTKQDVLASGSIDGLMNVFDLSQASEEEALMYTLNTESSVVN